ncbi:MAG TPA: FAD-dependent oxidoreductase, partial [Polyangiaceae bacterium]
GVHTAYKLTNPPDGGAVTGVTSPSGVCLFEKNDRLGGRIRDVQFGPDAGDVTGTGAYRMYDIQYTYALANELGVTTEPSFAYSNLRGLQDPGGNPGQYFGYSGTAFEGLYGVTMNDDQMWGQLMCGPQVPKSDAGFPDYTAVADGGIATMSTLDYTRSVLGDAGAQYFFDQNRFRADFVSAVDAIGYLQYSVIDYYGPETVLYPVPGHSALIGEMKKRIEAAGGRIFLSEPASSVQSQADGTFTVQTSGHTVHAKQVVLAVPQGAMSHLTGDVLSTITAAKEFNSVTSAKSMQVTHQWNKSWWHGDLRYPDAGAVVGGDLPDGSAPILRADTTIKPDGYCINSIEMPYTAQRDALMVTRSVYSDDRACVDANLTLYGDGGTAGVDALNAEILKSLRILFPAVFDGTANEPQITKTDVNVHDEAWFYLKTGATANGVTLKSLFDWSVAPVAGKNVFLVGDAWYPLGSGWSNAAYISSIRVLDSHFGMSIPSHELQPIACP